MGDAGMRWCRLLCRRRSGVRLLVVTGALSVFAAGCASLANTPAQDLAQARWAACRAQVAGAELNRIQSDGRIAFWSSGPGDEQAMLECLRREGRGGPALPEPVAESRPGGGGGGM